MEDTDVNTSNKEQGGNTVISAAAAASATTTPPTTGVLLSTATVCHILRHEFENIRKALTCSICLSTYEDPVTLSTCVHAYCAKCIQQFAANQKLASGKHHQKRSSPSCPLCQTPYTRRSIQPARDLPITVNAYKHAVRQFGLAPVKYTPTLAMTQLQDDEDFNDNVYDEQQHEQLMAARTFARVLREQQQSATGEIMTTTGAAFLLQEQEQIVAVNEQCVMGRHRNKQQQQRDDEHEEQHPTFSQIIHQAQSQEVANNGGYISEEDNFYSARLLPPTPDDPTKDQNSKPAARPSEEQPPFAADGNKSSSSMPCRRPSVAQILLQEEKQSSASMPQSQDEALTLPVEKTKTSPITNSAVQNSLQHSLPSQETASSFFQNGNNCLSQESVFERHSSQGAPPFPTPEYCSPIAASHPTQKNNDQKRAPNSSVRAMVAAMEQSNEGSSGGHHASTTISSSSRTPVSSGNKIMVGPSPLAAAMDAINTTTVLAQTPPSPPDNVNTLASKSSAKRDDKNDVSARGVDASPVVPSVEEDDTAADGRNNEKGSGAARNEVAAVEGPIRPNTTAHERPETLTVETAMDESHIDIGTGIEHTTSPVMSAGDLNVGDVVDVQSRTWPGVNQPGGVAKVTRVHKNDDDGSLFYDVLYVLDRRREKKVDAVFVSLQTEIDSATKDTSRLSCRSSSRRSPKEETIPPELRARLIAEGCDVDGEATERALARMDESSAAAAKENTVTLQENHSQTFPKKKVAPKALVESKKRKTDKQTLALKNSAAPVEPTDATRKRRKSDPTPIEAKPELPCVLPHWTDNVKCEKADNYYRRRINAAIIKGMVYLCISFLSEQEENSLKELCRQAKNTKGKNNTYTCPATANVRPCTLLTNRAFVISSANRCFRFDSTQ